MRQRRVIAATILGLATLVIAGSCSSTDDSSAAATKPAPSQSTAAAARDHIVPELALLPLDQRLAPLRNQYDAVWTQQIEAPEGIYRISQLPYGSFGTDATGCVFGDPDGEPGRDNVCLADYVEILLLDSETGEILRAYPFSGTAMNGLQLTDDAVYCFRDPDGGYPNLMFCRIDRLTGEAIVRMWPTVEPGSTTVRPIDSWVPPNWFIEDEPPRMGLDLPPTGRALIEISSQGQRWVVDAATLELFGWDAS